MKEGAASTDGRMESLDLVRFFAAMSVVLYHYVTCYAGKTESVGLLGHLTRYGYLGVDLFFVISGFVILWSASGRGATKFIISRASRLFPSFWVSILIALAALYVFARTTVAPGTIAANATMIPGLIGFDRIQGIYWTLEIEARFYGLILALILLRQMKNVELWLYLWLGISAAAHVMPVPSIVKFVILYPYGPFFIGGCLLYVITRDGVSKLRVAAATLSAVLSAYVAFSNREEYLSPDAVSAIVVPCVVLLFYALFIVLLRYRGARVPGAAWLGALTYPLYLTHATLGELLYSAVRPRMGLWLSLALTLSVAVAVAVIITKFVDEPGRHMMAEWLRRLTSRSSEPAKAVIEAARPNH